MSWMRNRRDTTDHQYVEERLSAYLDGELSPQEKRAVSQHLVTCQDCQWQLDTLQQTVQWTRALPTIPVPRVFTIPAPAQPVPDRRQRRGWLPLLQGATALIALLLVVVVAGDVMLTGVAPASLPAMAPQPEEVILEQAVADAAPTLEAAKAEMEIVVESEAAAEAVGAELEQAPAPRAAVPAESPAEEPEAPAMLEAEVAPTQPAETGSTAAMGAGSPDVQEKAADEAAMPLAAMAEEAVEEAEPTVEEAEPTPALLPTDLPTEQPPTSVPPTSVPPTSMPPTSVPTSVAQALERSSVAAELSGIQALGLMRQQYLAWLRLVECSLGTLFIVLSAVIVVAIVRWRQTS